ncbi:MAG: nitroreductase family deazaflavin-dependent oxidoreductase [Chloroflexi bacterium]|nr:nitroreductase family deazaflavin-dependent oxidoreductase [Chloroflexota bacterium]
MADPDVNEWNKNIMKEFHENAGKVGGMFANMPMLILTTTGAKSGEKRTTPLVYLPDGDRYVIIASKGGAPTQPAWYHNLVANPTATIEVGTEAFETGATIYATGEERDRLYRKQASMFPGFADYEKKTTRTIPVVVLTRKK